MTKTKKLVFSGLLCAVSIILLYIPFLRMPLVAAAPFLEYDAMDIPIIIGGFMLGPVYGIVLTVVCALIQGLTVSSASGIYGIIMHIIATGVLVTVSSLIYKANKTRLGLIMALIAGSAAMVAVMVPANLIVTPIFTGWPQSAVRDLLLPGIIPFNALKAGINSVVAFLVYVPFVKRSLISHRNGSPA